MAPYFTMSQDGALHIDGDPPTVASGTSTSGW